MNTIIRFIYISIVIIILAGSTLAAARVQAIPTVSGPTRVSVASDGTQADDLSDSPDFSADGRYVAFHSLATNLVEGDTNDAQDVFVHDRQTGVTTLASVASDGTLGNGVSGITSISADGRYVAFYSWATNLVADDTNYSCDTDFDGDYDDNCRDVFVHDMQTGETTMISRASDGTQANSHSTYPAISADGRYVAFSSDASNLVAGDTNGLFDIFVHDRNTGISSCVSVSSSGTQGNGNSAVPSISATGRYVVFHSYASDLVEGDTNNFCDNDSDGDYDDNCRDVFLRDQQYSVTIRISMTDDGIEGNGYSEGARISADGRFVAYSSSATNLVEGDINGYRDIFVYNLTTHVTTMVSVASDGTQGNYWSDWPSISADGSRVVFGSGATTLVPRDFNGYWDVYLYEMATGKTTMVSRTDDGSQGNHHSWVPIISGDGNYAVYVSWASNLVPDDTNEVRDILVQDLNDLWSGMMVNLPLVVK